MRNRIILIAQMGFAKFFLRVSMLCVRDAHISQEGMPIENDINDVYGILKVAIYKSKQIDTNRDSNESLLFSNKL